MSTLTKLREIVDEYCRTKELRAEAEALVENSRLVLSDDAEHNPLLVAQLGWTTGAGVFVDLQAGGRRQRIDIEHAIALAAWILKCAGLSNTNA